MKKNLVSLGLSLLLCFFSFLSYCQITIMPTNVAATLASKLVGPGVVIISPTLTCPTDAAGTFSGVSSLSFDSGIVLTNGRSQTLGMTVGADGDALGFANSDDTAAGDAQLSALAGQTTFDACVLEFDFRPAGDTVKFKYVFGSEEYTNFTCSQFNDVFGFFISGPGYATPKNIAIVPGTTIPVCINSVNCGATGGYPIDTCNVLGAGSPFCTYYVDNQTGTTISYDGLTVTLTAIALVTPCDTYHLKMGVADAVDDFLDSGVFLEAGSLTSSVPTHVSSLGINATDTGYGSQFCVRGCVPGKFIFTRTRDMAHPLTVHYTIGGTAVNGYDYTTIADSVVVPAGSATDTLYINPLTVPAAGPKTVTLYILATYACNGVPVVIDSAQLTIYDSLYVHINTPDTIICAGQSVLINTSGDPHLVYSWAPSATLDNDTLLMPTATPGVSTTYKVSAVFPGSGCAPSRDEMTITIDVPLLDIHTADTVICMDKPVMLKTSYAKEHLPNTFGWTPASGLSDVNVAEPFFSITAEGTYKYYLTMHNAVGCSAADSITINVKPPISVKVVPDKVTIFDGDHLQLNVLEGPMPALYYYWKPDDGSLDNDNINNPIATPHETTTYTVYATNGWCLDSAQVTINVAKAMEGCIPSAFSPNGDGLNDVFRICGLHNNRLVSFCIYNRWGQLVYENRTDPSKGWDGTLNGVAQDADVYDYMVILAKNDGTNVTYKGTVTLIR